MQKLAVALALALAVPAAAQFPGLNLDPKKLQNAAQKEADKTAKDAQKEAQKEAVKTTKEALKGDLVDTIALPRGDAKAPTTFAKFSAVLAAAELDKVLKGKGPFTVFAPTDAAFAKIPKADLDALLKDKAKLTAVLTYHVVPGAVMAKDVKAGNVKTVQGGMLTIGTTGGVTVNNAKVVQADIVASNGVIHVIDTVVLPK
jgi:uncharacterized surface protein with fasciclin (FAS1) repeats